MKNGDKNKKQNEATIRSAAEYLTYVASTGDNPQSLEMRCEDENIWLTQKMLSVLYDVSVQNIGRHIKKIYADSELSKTAEIAKAHAETEFKKYRIVRDRLFMSGYDKYIERLSQAVQNGQKGGND
jgi:hypothetical protein